MTKLSKCLSRLLFVWLFSLSSSFSQQQQPTTFQQTSHFSPKLDTSFDFISWLVSILLYCGFYNNKRALGVINHLRKLQLWHTRSLSSVVSRSQGSFQKWAQASLRTACANCRFYNTTSSRTSKSLATKFSSASNLPHSSREGQQAGFFLFFRLFKFGRLG